MLTDRTSTYNAPARRRLRFRAAEQVATLQTKSAFRGKYQRTASGSADHARRIDSALFYNLISNSRLAAVARRWGRAIRLWFPRSAMVAGRSHARLPLIRKSTARWTSPREDRGRQASNRPTPRPPSTDSWTFAWTLLPPAHEFLVFLLYYSGPRCDLSFPVALSIVGAR